MSIHDSKDKDERQAAEQLAARIDAGMLEPQADDPAELKGLLRAYRELQALSAEPDPAFERRLRHTLSLDEEAWATPEPEEEEEERWRWPRLGLGQRLVDLLRPRGIGGLGVAVFTVFLAFSLLLPQNQATPQDSSEQAVPTPDYGREFRHLEFDDPYSRLSESANVKVDDHVIGNFSLYSRGEATRGGEAQPAEQRMLVQQIGMSLVMADTNAGLERVRAIVAERKGYIQGLESTQISQEHWSIKLAIRVPTETLQETLQQLRTLGKYVAHETLLADDQTETYVDVQARLKNLALTEAELQKLLQGAQERNDDVEDILSISKELSGVREQIEKLQAQKLLLEKSVALTRVDLQLHPETNAPAPAPGFSPGAIVTEAWESLLEVLKSLATGGLWLLVYVPLLVVVVAVALVARRIIRRRRGEE